MKENYFQTKLKEGLIEGGAFVKVVHGNIYSSGWPDLYICHPLFHGHIELKIKHKLTPNQKNILLKLAAQNVPALTAKLDGGMVHFTRYYSNNTTKIVKRSLHICSGTNFLIFLSKI